MAKKEIVPVEWLEKNMPRGGACSYYLESETGAVSEHANDICHARALPGNAYLEGKEIASIHSALPEKSGAAVAKRYYDFLFNKERSPYRQAFKGLEVYKREDGSYIGFSILDTDVLTCLVGSLCIASRTPWEFPSKAEVFSRALDAGLKDTEAYYICQITAKEYNGNRLSVENANGHTTIYNHDGYNYYGRMNNQYTTHSLKALDSGELNYYKLGPYSNCIYKKKQACEKMYKMFEGDDGKCHPFLSKFAAKVETYYYKGRFGALAKADPNFPIPFRPVDNGNKMVSIQDLVSAREQWSAL